MEMERLRDSSIQLMIWENQDVKFATEKNKRQSIAVKPGLKRMLTKTFS